MQRIFFLRFNTEVLAERHEAFRELSDKIGVAPSDYLYLRARVWGMSRRLLDNTYFKSVNIK